MFKATRIGNNWVCRDLHDFQQGGNGVFPIAGVTLDALETFRSLGIQFISF